MASIYPLEGLNYINKLIANKQIPSNLEIRIYTNEATLEAGTNSTYFVDLVHPDYSPTIIDPSLFSTNFAELSTINPVEWQLLSGGVSIVGYYIIVDGVVLYAVESSLYVSSGVPVEIPESGAIIRFDYNHNLLQVI